MKKNNKELTTAPIPHLIRKLTIPVSMGMFFHTMYNVVDTWYGGMISTEALAAMSMSLPVFFIMISVGNGLSTGTTALIGTALGADDEDRARRYSAQGVSFGLIMSAILTAAGLWASPHLFRILGASDEYLKICLAYMDILFMGTVFFLLTFMMNAILNAQGMTHIYRNFLFCGFLLNIVLDPWFIFGGYGVPAMGVAGIALATILTYFLGAVYMGIVVAGTGMLSRNILREMIPRKEPYIEIARQGFPAGLNMMTVALGVFVITWFISQFGPETLAAYNVGMRVEQLALLPVIGFNTTTLTLVARNHGANRMDRVHETLNKTLKYGGIMMAVGSVLVFVFARRLMAFFSDDPEVIEIGVGYLRVDALTLYAYIILFISVAALQGVKRPMFAIYIGIFRQLAAPFALFYLLTGVLDYGVVSIWWGIFGITWTAALISLVYCRRVVGGITEGVEEKTAPPRRETGRS